MNLMQQIVINNIYKLMRQQNMTPNSFATQFEMNPKTVNAIMQGESNPYIDTVEYMAMCLGVSMEYLYSKNDASRLDENKEKLYQRISMYTPQMIDRLVGYMDCLEEKGVEKG